MSKINQDNILNSFKHYKSCKLKHFMGANMDTKNMDKWDGFIAVGSGMLTAAIDVLIISDISLKEAHTWGSNEVETLVIKVAKSKKFNGEDDDLAGAVRHLENAYPIPADLLTNDFGGGLNHHLRDFSHHPTLVGLLFSIISQFTGCGYGTDTQGNFIKINMKDKGFERKDIISSIYMGIIAWFFHLISDMAGSSGSIAAGKEGTGIPGPILSLLKELSSVPGIKQLAGKSQNKGPNNEYNYKFSLMCTKLFQGTLIGGHDENGKLVRDSELRFDLRTEIGIVDQAIINKQYVPIVLNEIFVRALYSIRRFIEEISANKLANIDAIKQIGMENVLFSKGKRLPHMLTLSNVTFTSIDITSAYVKAKIKNKNNKSGFALDFMQGINYAGLLRLMVSSSTELGLGSDKLYTEIHQIAEKQKEKLIALLSVEDNPLDLLTKAGTAGITIAKLGTPYGFVSATIDVYKQVSTALEEKQIAHEERIRIEAICAENIELIENNRKVISLAVSEYMEQHLQVFSTAIDKMNQAIIENDVNLFIEGNNLIQNDLGHEIQFTNMDEFEEMMSSDNNLKL